MGAAAPSTGKGGHGIIKELNMRFRGPRPPAPILMLGARHAAQVQLVESLTRRRRCDHTCQMFDGMFGHVSHG